MKKKTSAAVLILAAAGFFHIATADAKVAKNKTDNQCGQASWYALTSKTASGERMNPAGMTAAHRTLPLGSKIEVVNPNNGKSLVVRVNDRGPFIKGRMLDVSKGAAQKLGFVNKGHTHLCFRRL